MFSTLLCPTLVTNQRLAVAGGDGRGKQKEINSCFDENTEQKWWSLDFLFLIRWKKKIITEIYYNISAFVIHKCNGVEDLYCVCVCVCVCARACVARTKKERLKVKIQEYKIILYR